MRALLSVAAAALLSGGPAHAQDITGEIDEIFSWVTPSSPGCVVGVSQHGKVLVNRAYGMADLERGVPLTPGSVFDIGSAHKQHVAAAVLLLVQEGRLSLSDDIRKYVPELPDYGHTITIDHLLTHTSGIRDWVWLSSVTEAREDALTLILRQRGLNFAPGEEWSYSKQRLCAAERDRLARERADVRGVRAEAPVRAARDALDRLCAGCERGREPRRRVREGWRGMESGYAAWERSWRRRRVQHSQHLSWNDALTHNRLGAFVSEKIREPARLNNGRKLSYARGLMLSGEGDDEVVWHAGDAAAYKTILTRVPKQGFSLALLCNSGDGPDREDYEVRIMDLFLPPPVATGAGTPAGAEGAADVAAADLSDRAGLFFSERTGEPLRLAVNDGQLRIAGGPRLVTLSEDRFRNRRGTLMFMSEDEFELHFVAQDQLELKSMEGQTTRYRRAQSYAPSADELAAFFGRYETDEIGVVEITSGTGGLSAGLNDMPPIEFAPVHPDVFQRGPWTIRFRRDAAGKVVGLDLTSPAVRNANFPRQSDGTNNPAPAPTEPSTTELSVYEGTYALQAPNRVIDLRVWVDAEGRLNGELVGLGQPTTLRPSTAHKFLHATRDDVWFLFTMENGRATSVTAQQHKPARGGIDPYNLLDWEEGDNIGPIEVVQHRRRTSTTTTDDRH